MKINWLRYTNNNTKLHIEDISLNEDITLLVGLTGVGKTQIVRAIINAARLAVNEMPIVKTNESCTMCFVSEDKEYIWEYKIEEDINSLIEQKNEGIVFLKEKLYLVEGSEKKELFYREDQTIRVNENTNIIKPKKNESLISQYRMDENFQSVFNSFKQVILIETDISTRRLMSIHVLHKLEKNFNKKITNDTSDMSMEKLLPQSIFVDMPVPFKLYIMRKYNREGLFQNLLNCMVSIFPEIEDINVVEYNNNYCQIIIQAYGEQILQYNISNGMIKCLYYLTNIFMLPTNSVVCIDELENGLGINCLYVLLQILMDRNDIQYIITSHHPSILNKIPSQKWKIIDRNLENIINSSNTDLEIESLDVNENYYNLLNRWSYEGKI